MAVLFYARAAPLPPGHIDSALKMHRYLRRFRRFQTHAAPHYPVFGGWVMGRCASTVSCRLGHMGKGLK